MRKCFVPQHGCTLSNRIYCRLLWCMLGLVGMPPPPVREHSALCILSYLISLVHLFEAFVPVASSNQGHACGYSAMCSCQVPLTPCIALAQFMPSAASSAAAAALVLSACWNTCISAFWNICISACCQLFTLCISMSARWALVYVHAILLKCSPLLQKYK